MIKQFKVVVEKHPDGTWTPLTIPNHARIKGSTLRTICTQAGIPRDDFLNRRPHSNG